MNDRLELYAVPGVPRVEFPTDVGELVRRALVTLASSCASATSSSSLTRSCRKRKDRCFSLSSVVPSARAIELARAADRIQGWLGDLVGEQEHRPRRRAPLDNGAPAGFHLCKRGRRSIQQRSRDRPRRPAPARPRHVRPTCDTGTPRLRVGGARSCSTICDTHGRPFRNGAVGVTIGIAGMEPVVSWRGSVDY